MRRKPREGYTATQMERLLCDSSTLAFTQYMFWRRTGQPWRDNPHHHLICDALDRVLSGQCRRLMINIAPRYSKTELVSKAFIEKGFSVNPASRFIHLSYSDDLVLDNSREIHSVLNSDYFRRLYPEVTTVGTSGKSWKTTAGGGLYAVSSAGQVTGFGAGSMDVPEIPGAEFADGSSSIFSGAIVIDDPLKPEDALSDVTRERVNSRFESTIRSRVNSRNTPIIIVMQRLHEHDLCGYLLEREPDQWEVLSLPCLTYDDDGSPRALWPFKQTVEELLQLEKVSPFVFETQYQQNPKPLEGLMYQEFRTYETLPVGSYRIKCYCDTADTGADYLCAIVYAEFETALYVLDVLFTDKPMEYTEPTLARMLTDDAVQTCIVESNNGGRGFRRNVEQNCRVLGNGTTAFKDFTQSANKAVRIFTRSAEVNNLVYFPEGWEYRFRDFYNAISSYRKAGRNAHDDAPDALTGLVEHRDISQTSRFSRT